MSAFGVGMEISAEHVGRFIEAFEQRYGRKPELEDAEGDFKLRVAEDMQMSAGGARYYLRAAAEHQETMKRRQSQSPASRSL